MGENICDPKPMRKRLSWSITLMALAVGFVVVASAVNRSVFSAMSSPLLMALAGGCAVAGAALLWGALSELEVFCDCAGAECAAKGPHVRWMLTTIQLVLGVEAAACFTAAAHVWVPALAQPAMWVIIGAALVQFALFNAALGFVVGLIDCHFKTRAPA